MGKHSKWRKLVKKLRRKRIRQQNAQIREQTELEEFIKLQNSPSYHNLLAEKIKIDERKALEAAELQATREIEWLRVEKEAQKQFQELQKKLAIAREERAKQNELIKIEWAKEQKKRAEKKKNEEDELCKQIKQQELLQTKVEEFLELGGDTPEHLKTLSETNPNKPLCPFFHKTSTCRFFDVCSRNHVRPGISKTILIPNFFSHYSLEKTESEQYSDYNLEFELHETNACYREFYKDVVPELEKCGDIRLFATCCNREAHLRGNVFVEFFTNRDALRCYRALNGRWYGGKQLSVQFASIPKWKSAVCGVQLSNRCPKGSSCNFLHTFRNPRNYYSVHERIRASTEKEQRNSSRSRRNNSEVRNWRWSESPERTPLKDDWETDVTSTSRSRLDLSSRSKRQLDSSSSSRRQRDSSSTSSSRQRNSSSSSRHQQDSSSSTRSNRDFTRNGARKRKKSLTKTDESHTKRYKEQ